MKVDILASGSGGNCVAITINERTILIDVGIAKTKVEKALLEVDIRPDQVEAIFITHAHGDHVKGLPMANKYKIPVYAGADEWKDIKSVDEDLQLDLPENDGHSTGTILFDYEGSEEWFKVSPFNVHHDSYDPRGYVVQSDKKKVSICLDTGNVDADMLSAMKDSDVYIIEANHEPGMVEASKYPNSVKVRIMSHIGHLSNQQTAEALSKLIKGKGEQIYLVHLSSNNNMAALAELTVKRELHKKGFVVGKHYKIEVK